MFDVLPNTHPWKETITNMKQWLLRNAIVNKFNIFFLLRFPTSTPPCSSSRSRWRWLVAASGRGYTWWCIDRDVWLFAWGDVTSDLMRWVGLPKIHLKLPWSFMNFKLLVLRTKSIHDSNSTRSVLSQTMSKWKKSMVLEKAINNQCLKKYIVGHNILWTYVAEWFAFSMTNPWILSWEPQFFGNAKCLRYILPVSFFSMVYFKVQGNVVKYSGRQWPYITPFCL